MGRGSDIENFHTPLSGTFGSNYFHTPPPEKNCFTLGTDFLSLKITFFHSFLRPYILKALYTAGWPAVLEFLEFLEKSLNCIGP